MVQKLGGAVLGIKWDTEAEKFSIPLTVNVSRRRRGMTTHPDVTSMSVEAIHLPPDYQAKVVVAAAWKT